MAVAIISAIRDFAGDEFAFLSRQFESYDPRVAVGLKLRYPW
jgi:hypothetical protein